MCNILSHICMLVIHQMLMYTLYMNRRAFIFLTVAQIEMDKNNKTNDDKSLEPKD